MLRKALPPLTAALVLANVACVSIPSRSGDQLSSEQEIRIRQYVAQERRSLAPLPAGYRILVGAEVPPGIELQPFPTEIGVPQYRYAVIGSRIVLVRQATRRIVEVYGISF